jgi:hypothetical protein
MSTPRDRIRTRARDERGTALAEFALVLPILLVIVLATLDAGKAFNYWIDSTHLANEAARYAAVHKRVVAGQSIEQSIINQATTNELKSKLDICIRHPTGPGGTTGQNGDPVEVKVESSYGWLQFLVGRTGIATTTLRGVASMRIESAYTNDGTYTANRWFVKGTAC